MRPTHCLVCGRPLAQKPRGRPRTYCSNACRQQAFRLRQKQREQSAAPTAGKVRVVHDPEGLFGGRAFTWSDFQASLGVWPAGMRVIHRGVTYEVQGARLVEVAESERGGHET